MIYLIALAGVGVLAAMSFAANRRFQALDRLPMQWSLSGHVNWTAPRAWALLFTPILAALVLGVLAWRISSQNGSAIFPLAYTALVFIAAHVLHLWRIERHVRRRYSPSP